MVKNINFTESLDTNQYIFRHYDITEIYLFLIGKQFPSESLSTGMNNEKTSLMGYRTVFEAPGLHHSNSELEITHNLYINGYFMLLFYLTPDRGRRRVTRPNPRMAISGSS